MVSFQHFKQNLISKNISNNKNSVNLSSTNLVTVINDSHKLSAPNIPNCNSFHNKKKKIKKKKKK